MLCWSSIKKADAITWFWQFMLTLNVMCMFHLIGGPYYIVSTEPVDGTELFWKVKQKKVANRTKYVIGCTTNRGEASEFLIELDYSHSGKFFHITTTDDGEDGEDKDKRDDGDSQHPSIQKVSSVTADGKDEHDDSGANDREDKHCSPPSITSADASINEWYTGSLHKLEVKRYVHMEIPTIFSYRPRGGLVDLALHATVVGDSARKTARFRVRDHRTQRSKDLSESGWLPVSKNASNSQASFRRRFNQPCFIRPRKHFYCLAVEGLAPRSAVEGLAPRSPVEGLAPRSAVEGLAPHSAVEGLARKNYHFKLRRESRHLEGKCHMLFSLIHADPIGISKHWLWNNYSDCAIAFLCKPVNSMYKHNNNVLIVACKYVHACVCETLIFRNLWSVYHFPSKGIHWLIQNCGQLHL